MEGRTGKRKERWKERWKEGEMKGDGGRKEWRMGEVVNGRSGVVKEEKSGEKRKETDKQAINQASKEAIPGNLDDAVIETGLEAGRSCHGDGILQFGQRISER